MWPTTMWGPAKVMVRIFRLSVSLSRSNISETARWTDGYYETRLETWVSRFRICHQIRDRKYGSAILGVSGLALRPFRQKWVGWPREFSEWISGNSHQSAPHWAPWRTSYRHVPSRTIGLAWVDQLSCMTDRFANGSAQTILYHSSQIQQTIHPHIRSGS